jgi:hypothetical protein
MVEITATISFKEGKEGSASADKIVGPLFFMVKIYNPKNDFINLSHCSLFSASKKMNPFVSQTS